MVRPGHANAVQGRERAGSAKPVPMTKNGGKNFNEEDRECQSKRSKLMFLVASWDNSMTIFVHFKNRHFFFCFLFL